MKKPALRPKPTYGTLLATWEIAIARGLVRRLWTANTNLKNTYEFEELLDYCLLHWLEKRDRWREDGGAGRKTFMRKVVFNYLLQQVRDLDAALRSVNHQARLLSEGADPEDEDRTYEDEAEEATGHSDPELTFEMRDALAGALGELTDRQRRICELRAQDKQMVEIAELLHISRDTAHEDFRRASKTFEDKGLRKFLD